MGPLEGQYEKNVTFEDFRKTSNAEAFWEDIQINLVSRVSGAARRNIVGLNWNVTSFACLKNPLSADLFVPRDAETHLFRQNAYSLTIPGLRSLRWPILSLDVANTRPLFVHASQGNMLKR